jgi:hypothetical protein
MKPPTSSKRLYLLTTAIILMIILGLTLSPHALARYHQIKGGGYLEAALDGTETGDIVTDYCSPVSLDGELRTLVNKARGHLERSIHYQPSYAHTHLLLGRANCMLENPKNAVESYAAYSEFRPDNPLGHIELALALGTLCADEAGSGVNPTGNNMGQVLCPDPAARTEIRSHWNAARIPHQRLVDLGSQSFSNHQYDQAVRWYLHAWLLKKYQSDMIPFHWEIAYYLSGGAPLEGSGFLVNLSPISVAPRIEGEDLQWMVAKPDWDVAYGDPLGASTAGDHTVGVMWWRGSAVALFRVPESGAYNITIRAQNSPPAPVQIQLELDFEALEQFEWTQGDMSFQDYHAETTLTTGAHVIGLRFMNDGSVNGVDRNAFIDWIDIQRK